MSGKNIILIDAGNQRLKWRRASVDHCLDWTDDSHNVVLPKWENKSPRDEALVASVRSETDNTKLTESLQSAGFQVRFARVAEEQQGLICGYRMPEQLGIDRWLAMLACWARLERGFILVSAGTALTVDLVFSTGKHGGGYIAAGLGLGRSALLSRSEKLRSQYSAGPAELSPGRDTASAIDNGALIAGVGLIRSAKSLAGMGRAELVISGGDAPTLAPHFPGAILWENIVLDGLQVWGEVTDREK